jgi:hypothetical protein
MKESVGEAVGELLAQKGEKVRIGAEKVEALVGASAHKPVAGGPLDQLGQQTAESVSKSTKSWTDRLTGR